MAESLVFEVLQKLASLLYEEVSLITGVRAELEKLQSNLQAIQAVLSDAENRQWKEAVVKRWLDKLKDVSYDIDDVLDEWSTAILKREVNHKSDNRYSSQVFSLLPTCCFSCYQIPFRYDVADKITELNARLDVIACEKDRYSFNQLVVNNEHLVEQRTTTSLVNITEVKGRSEEKQEIVDKLLGESSQTLTLRTISLVGMGGIGKTTLAKLVYNDNDVKNHFDVRIWVCVSNPFDEIRVAKAILESLMGVTPNLVELQGILEQTQRFISGKRFLLVLDDVWTEDRSKWEQLKCSLLSGLPGSRILATTRKENVAKMIGCTKSDIFPVGHLSEDECLALFTQIAFSECTGKTCVQLEGVCKEIVAKCKGLPLAIRMLGSLCSGKSRADLESILESEVWELEEAEVELFPHLLLSYYDLPSALKRCFSYCAIFPKDYTIEKHKLIESWMALGYLKATPRETLEKIGEKYFQKLAICSLFQDYEVDRNDGSTILSCHMHDIVHDFSLFITKNESFVIEDIDYEETRTESFPREGRYARLIVADGAPLLNFLSGLKRLRSFKVQCSPNTTISGVQLTYLFEKLNLLRSLDLSNCNITEFPSAICKLVHLRQLDLSLNIKLRELPETVCELVNLQTLNVSCGDGFIKLPHGIGKLIQLRHLHNSKIGALPKGVGSLTNLRTLDYSTFGYGGKDFSLADLKNLNHLQGKLSITVLNGYVDLVAAKQAKLKTKTRIISLELSFEGEESRSRKHHDKGIMEELEPSPNLEHLFLSGYLGSVFPSWMMSLVNLKKLDLYSCYNCEHLPSLGKLPSLESLDLFRLHAVRRVGLEFLGMEPHTENETPASTCSNVAFPKLTHLSFSRMGGLEEWDDVVNGDTDEDTSSRIIMPSLQYLCFLRCHSLQAFPSHIIRRVKRRELNLTIKRCSFLRSLYQEDFSDLPNVNLW